ncbi:ABC transporter permease [Aliiglaciecola lipolytica]|uniref:Transport permease protein n=1 Tax=Aliiglaciecola lipolytica E3 TaxID=1127673 RepID=K6XNS7_9ALTE|nr:ABC transporter permease [Aliiglaciecola lipolytica]GAC13306.1 polysialic acid transport protein kpsM [Aliiglaciecola lipolytica E3]
MTTVIKRNKWEIWRDVIFALFAREIRTGFSDKLGLSWAFLNPIAFIFLLSAMKSVLGGGQDTHTMPTFVFMAYGLIFIQTFLQTLTSCATAIKKNKSLYAFRQVQPISAVLASGIFELLVKIAVVLGIFAIFYFMDIEIVMDNPLLIIYCIIMLWWLSMMLGLFFGVLTLYVPEMNKVLGLITRPLFFISGSFFSLQDIPREYWPFLDWNPILHAIELTRFGAYRSYGDEGVSLLFFTLSVIVITSISLALYYSSWRQAISR